MMFKFALNINDDNQQLTPENGLDFGDLSELTSHLRKALESRRQGKCVLSSIENHGYTPNFTTESELIYNKFLRVHTDIQEKSIADLTKEEATYANTLKKILSTDKYVEAIDTNRKTLVKLTSKDIETIAENYSVITNQSGIVSEIGSPKLEDNRHIYLHSLDYKIFITAAQEQILKDCYRKGFVELKLKQRRSIKTGRILNATLIDLRIKPDITLAESLSNLSEDELAIFENINTVDDILTLLRS
ncbi:MAG TPA: hypothetical protein PKC39_15185 [Ferruginibacter sp.]|nr:hypothetical protein [Ferruginibacter sp.]HMP22302.1 hypothetical protein [Ferruginibacter sp.]